MAHFVESPDRSEAMDKTRFTNVDFSEMPSFQAPAGKDNLLNAVRKGGNNHMNAFTTPRPALASRSRNPQARPEFTPLLKSATKNAMRGAGRDGQEKENGLATPAALRPGFALQSPGVGDATSLGDSSVMSDGDRTPVPQDVHSSSFENSTPMALPQGQLGDGNVLTLREQEAKLEKIDKENFGLKLKIHFLEENLKRTGSEWSQQAMRENAEMKVSQMTMERDLRKYRKQLLQAEQDLQAYKQQLAEYSERITKKHADEGMRVEFEKLRVQLEERETQLAEMQLRLESAENTMQSLGEQEKLRDSIEELEAEVRGKDRELDEKDDEIETLRAKLRDAEAEAQDSADSDEKDRQLQEQSDRIEELEAELKQATRQKDEELDAMQEELDAATREHSAEREDLRRDLESAQKDKRDQLREFETQLQAYNREKTAEIEDLRRKLAASEKDKADEIENLELRVKLAESKGDNQSQLAQQAAEDARAQVKQITAEKDIELEDLRARLQSLHELEDDLDACRKQLTDARADVEAAKQNEGVKDEALTKLRDAAADKDREIRDSKAAASDLTVTIRDVNTYKSTILEREREIANLKETISAQATSLEDLRRTRIELASREQALKGAYEEAKTLKTSLSDKDRQLETAKKTLESRTEELEVLRQENENNDEPGNETQLEGMQSILRHRDNDLETLREEVDELEAKLESLQYTADERLRTIDELRDQLAETKRDLEDEIQVLEATLDQKEDEEEKMQSKLRVLESQLEDTRDLQTKLSPMGKELRTAQREHARLQKLVDSLERDREVADQERESLQATIEKLRRDLKEAQGVPRLTPSRDRQIDSLRKQLDDLSAQLRTKEEKHVQEVRELQTLLRTSTLDLEDANIRLNTAERDLPRLQSELKTKNAMLADLQSDSTRQLHTQAQEGREEAARLRSDIMALEKKHVAELKGLAKQITVLRGRFDRERSFREGLGFQKNWFLGVVEMYGECNKADLRLLEEMGVTPDRSIRERRPSLKVVAKAVIFLERTRRMAQSWAEKKKLQDQLAMKVEGMRKMKAVNVRKEVGRRSLPLGTR